MAKRKIQEIFAELGDYQYPLYGDFKSKCISPKEFSYVARKREWKNHGVDSINGIIFHRLW